MIEQARWIKEFCDKEGFNFKEVDKVPCALDRNYKQDDMSIFIKGFIIGSKKITFSYGGLKAVLSLKKPIEDLDYNSIKKHCIPDNFRCAKCGEKNLNLRTQDDHKTYDCPKCHKLK